jgi:hypothetical protein
MSISGHDRGDRPLSTAEIAAAGRRPAESRPEDSEREVGDNEVTGTYEAPQFPEEREAAARGESTRKARFWSTRSPTDKSRSAQAGDTESDGNAVSADSNASQADTAREESARAAAQQREDQRQRDDQRRADTPGAAARPDQARPDQGDGTQDEKEVLEPLFTPDMAETYRSRWLAIQTSFVDDPQQAVRKGDELVAQIMTNLANTFSEERHRVEAQLGETGEGATENLRVALRRYHSFFERLLSL